MSAECRLILQLNVGGIVFNLAVYIFNEKACEVNRMLDLQMGNRPYV